MRFELQGVTSLTLVNEGDTSLYFRERTLKKGEIFVMEGDGSASQVSFSVEFEGGKGSALLDYRVLKKC